MNFSGRTNWKTSLNPLSEKAQALKKAGIPFLDMTESNPTRCGLSYLNEELLRPLAFTENLRYEPDPRGLLRAREAVCEYYVQKGIAVEPDRVFLTSGTSEAYQYLFRLLADPGDLALGPKPSYPLFEYLAGLNDVRLEAYPLQEGEEWRIDFSKLEEYGEEEPKAVIVVYPNNPTGHFTPEEEKARLIQFCRDRGSALIADEVFLDYPLAPDRKPVSFSGCREVLTFTLSGVSKILGLPQMKLSWIVVSGPSAEVHEAAARLEIIADAYLSPAAPAQNALPVWMKERPRAHAEILERVRGNLALLKEGEAHGARLFEVPSGGWYAPFRIPGNKTDELWAIELLEKEKILVHPGYLFDFEQRYGVLSLLPEPEIFHRGFEGIRHFLKETAGAH